MAIALLFEGGRARVVELTDREVNDFEVIQHYVGGLFTTAFRVPTDRNYPLDDGLIGWCQDDGIRLGLVETFERWDGWRIVGPVLITGYRREDSRGLTSEDLTRFLNLIDWRYGVWHLYATPRSYITYRARPRLDAPPILEWRSVSGEWLPELRLCPEAADASTP